MIKFLESKRIDFYLFPSLIIIICLSYLDFKFRFIPLVIIYSIYTLLYIVRIFLSFHNWKISKGISLINAYLNYQIVYALSGIGFTFLKWPGYTLMTYNAIISPLYFLLIIAIFLLFRLDKINWKLYWELIKLNIFRALIGITICIILFYSFDMSDKMNPYPPHKSWITLPK